jgi:hypothetical protein
MTDVIKYVIEVARTVLVLCIEINCLFCHFSLTIIDIAKCVTKS